MAEIIGLDIGSHSIKLVGLKTTPGGSLLTHLRMKEIPPGKEKADPHFISEMVKSLFREAGLKPGKVKMTISGSGVNIRKMTLPSMPKRELKEAVRWEMKNYLPYPVESARIEFHLLDAFVEKEINPVRNSSRYDSKPSGVLDSPEMIPERNPAAEHQGNISNRVKRLNLIAVACPDHLIDRVLSIAERAGLEATDLTMGPLATWSLLFALDGFKKEEVIASIDLGAEKTGISIFKNGVLEFSREFSPAGEDVTRAITEGMDPVEGDSLSLYGRSEKIKSETGILPKASDQRTDDQTSSPSKVSFLIRPVLERLAAEIRRSLDYYRNQYHEERMDRLLLIGGGANLKDLAPYLSGQLGLAVERFNPLKDTLYDTKRIDEEFVNQIGPMFALAFGTALSGARQINLLPAKEPFWSKIPLEKSIPAVSSFITLLIFSGIIWAMSHQAVSISKEREEKMARLKTLEALQTRLTFLKEKENQVKLDLSLFPSSVITPVPFRDVLRSVTERVPGNVTFQSLSIQSRGKSSKEEAQAGEERELHIKGLAFGSDLQCLSSLARLIESLEESSLLRNARLISADENKHYNKPATDFEIVCNIDLDPRPSSSDRTGTTPGIKDETKGEKNLEERPKR
jgi:type IV pilus assembly protein PilM